MHPRDGRQAERAGRLGPAEPRVGERGEDPVDPLGNLGRVDEPPGVEERLAGMVGSVCVGGDDQHPEAVPRGSRRDHLTMIAAFSITPLGVGTAVSEPVAEAVRLVRNSGLPNETNAMFTNVEGEWDEVMALIKACVMTVAEAAPRVSVVIKVDHRPGVTDALHAKVDAIEQRLRAP